MTSWSIFRGRPEIEAARRDHEAKLGAERSTHTIERAWLKKLCLEAGAADAGVVEIERTGLGAQAENARRIFPRTRALLAIVTPSNADAIRSVSRATANLAWQHNHHELDRVTHRIVAGLHRAGVHAVATSIGFPMRFEPGQTTWEIAHKVVAVEAGLGHMGVNRNVIHPRFGNFVLLETVLIDADVDGYDSPLEYNPCNGCNLCVASCPVGAVRHDDHFDFMACLEHNYREFLFGFEDWVHTIADGDRAGYQAKFTGEETRSMWQSLGFGPNYKSAYCQAVCPAGDDVIGPYMSDPAAWRRDVLVPLLRKEETVYVRSGSRAEHVAKRNRSKRVRYIDFDPTLSTPENFVLGLRHRFDPARADAAGVEVCVGFTLPDGSRIVAEVDRGDLGVHTSQNTAGTGSDGHLMACDVEVQVHASDYIRLLHPAGRVETPSADHAAMPAFTLVGDAQAYGALLSTFS